MFPSKIGDSMSKNLGIIFFTTFVICGRMKKKWVKREQKSQKRTLKIPINTIQHVIRIICKI